MVFSDKDKIGKIKQLSQKYLRMTMCFLQLWVCSCYLPDFLHIGAGPAGLIELQQMKVGRLFWDTVYVHANECIAQWFVIGGPVCLNWYRSANKGYFDVATLNTACPITLINVRMFVYVLLRLYLRVRLLQMPFISVKCPTCFSLHRVTVFYNTVYCVHLHDMVWNISCCQCVAKCNATVAKV